MAECIEREALIKKLRIMPIPKQAGSANTWLDNCAAGVNAAIREVASFPATDVAPIEALEHLRDELCEQDLITMEGLRGLNTLIWKYTTVHDGGVE